MRAQNLFSSLIVCVSLFIVVVDATTIGDHCSEDFQKVVACLSCATGKAAEPTKECCTSVGEIKDKDPMCLCYVMQQTLNGSEQIKGMGIQVSRFLQLLTDCKLTNASSPARIVQVSLCLARLLPSDQIIFGSTARIVKVELNFALDRSVMGLPQISTTENGDSVVVSYESWQLKHPSALDKFEQMMSIAKGKKIVVFLDYDGTLAKIVDNPEKANMTNKMRTAVHKVASCFPTGIISGRGRDKVFDFVQLDNVYYAGSHGLDITAPSESPNYGDPEHQTKDVDRNGNEIVIFQPAKKYLPAIKKIFSDLSEKTRSIRGTMIEDNKFCISVHFRHVKDEDFDSLEKLVNSLVQEYVEFRVSKGKKVFEIRPDMEWDKGHALNYLLDTLGLGNSSDILPLYIGDDRTDEDAFKAIRNRGDSYPIVVSSIPKDSVALYSLRDPAEVKKFLIRLVRWKKKSSSGKFVV